MKNDDLGGIFVYPSTAKDIIGSLDETNEVIKRSQPREADMRVLVDFDATMYPFGYLFNAPAPLEGTVEFMNKLKTKGYTIGIFTSRLSEEWLKRVNQTAAQHIAYITAVCTRDKIPFDFITGDKVPATYYIDDKAIRFENNWTEIWDTYFEGDE